MGLFGPNKFIVEQQIVRAKLLSDNEKLQQDAEAEIHNFPTLGTIYALKTKKFTQEEINEVEVYIAEQRKKYSDSLNDLFGLWETLVGNKKAILLGTAQATAGLQEQVAPNISVRSAESISITGHTIKKGGPVLLGEQRAIFTGNYQIDSSGNITDVEININGKPAYARIQDLTPNDTGANQSPIIPSESTNTLKYSLEQLGGYATQELAKSGYTIQSLQKILQIKAFYKGELNGKFDQATLDAVIAFQKTIPNSKYGADGLVGSREVIPALFGTKPQANSRPAGSTLDGTQNTLPGPTRRTDGEPEVSRRPRIDAAPPAQTQSNPSESKPESLTESMKKLNYALVIFRNAIQSVSKTSGVIFDAPEEIERYKKSINEALIPTLKALRSIEGNKLSKEEKAKYDSAVMEISRYFSNDTTGIKNRHYRNYDLSFDLALSLIKDDLKKQQIEFKPRPSQDDVLKSLATLDPKLQQKIKTDLRAGYELGQILSNPQVRSQWESVYEKIYGKWEDEMQTLLTRLKTDRPTLASVEGQAALDQMISIMGTKDFFDFKARTRDLAGQTAGMIGSTVAGIGAFMVTPATGGTSAILGGALLSGVVTTAGMIATKGRGGLDRETLTELGINTATFGLGGAIAKSANVIAQSGKLLAHTAGIAVDATGGLALGMGADYVRAWEAETSITLKDSFKNNWYWALLPMALGMKGALRTKAEAVHTDMNHARNQSLIGDYAGANQTIVNAEKKVAELAKDVKSTQNTATKSSVTPHPTDATVTPKVSTKSTAQAGENVVHNSLTSPKDISPWLKSAIPKKPEIGKEIKLGDITITPKAGGKYEMKHGNETITFDTIDNLTRGINAKVSAPADRLKLIQSSNIKSLDNHFAALTKDVPNTSVPTRLARDADGRLMVEIQDAATGGWVKKGLDTLSDDDAIKVFEHYTHINPKQVREGWIKAKSSPIENTVSSDVKQNIIQRWGSKAWDQITGGYKKAQNSTISGAKFLFWDAPKGTASFITGIGSRGTSLKEALIVSSLMEGLDLMINPNERELNFSNIGEFIFRMTAIGFMGKISGTAAIGLWNWYASGYPLPFASSSPGSQVPTPQSAQDTSPPAAVDQGQSESIPASVTTKEVESESSVL